MFTFYIVGVVIALLILLTSLGIMIENGEVYELDIIDKMVGIFVLSASSWAIVVVIGAVVIIERVKNKEDK